MNATPRTKESRPKGRRAWLVRWEWDGDHAAVEQPVAAILSPRLGGKQVRDAVEMLHAARMYTPDEMLRAAQQHGGFDPYPAEFGTVSVDLGSEVARVRSEGEVLCGHNPFLVARKARVWPLGDGSGGVGWEDDGRATALPPRAG